MELSVREVASLLGKSPRTVRAQVARGDIPARKSNGRWLIERNVVPLTESQRRLLQGRADALRKTLDDALPSRLAHDHGRRFRSIADLEAFRKGAALLAEIRAADSAVPADLIEAVSRFLECGLLALAEAASQYDRELKLAALNRARAHLARAVARLLLDAGIPPTDPVHGWVVALEAEVIPAVAGFARWTERLKRRDR